MMTKCKEIILETEIPLLGKSEPALRRESGVGHVFFIFKTFQQG